MVAYQQEKKQMFTMLVIKMEVILLLKYIKHQFLFLKIGINMCLAIISKFYLFFLRFKVLLLKKKLINNKSSKGPN